MTGPDSEKTKDYTRRLKAAVSAFYGEVRKDDMLGPVFAARVHDWDSHIEKITNFWLSVLLASGEYKGSPVATHYAFRDHLSPQMFGRWEALWRESLVQFFDPDEVRHILYKTTRISGSLQTVLFDGVQRFLSGNGLLHSRRDEV